MVSLAVVGILYVGATLVVAIRCLFVFYSRSREIRMTWVYKDMKCPSSDKHFYDAYTPSVLVCLMIGSVLVFALDAFFSDNTTKSTFLMFLLQEGHPLSSFV